MGRTAGKSARRNAAEAPMPGHGRRALLGVAAGAAVAGLAACGGSGGGGTPEPPPTPVATTIAVDTPAYARTLLITVDGSRLDLLPVVTVPNCSGLTRSTTAPNASTATRAFYTCTVTATGPSSVSLSYNGTALRSQAFTVPDPQVTLGLTGGAVGNIVITLDPTRVKATVDNFLQYVADGYYEGTTFHRVVPGLLVQGGSYPPASTGQIPAAKAGLRAPVPLLPDAGQISNTALTVAMARPGGADTARAEFFINLADNSSLYDPSPSNTGFTVFGTIGGGANIVAAVAAAPCAPIAGFSDCAPSPDVLIVTATRTR